jgi:class 3 adenylate cyclase
MSIPAEGPRFCTECGSPLPARAKFCAECGTKVETPPEIPTTAEVAVPPELREKYEIARKELRGDRREVAVLFADVKGYTALSEKLDPEEVGLLMQRLLGELAAVVHRYEGYVDKFIGDAIMALFGAPIAHENDAERAVLAGLAMQEVLVRRETEAGIQLALRVGINLGTVVAAHVGSEAHLQYTVMGDAVNVASRLESAAEPDTVLISHTVYVRVASRFEVEKVPPLTLKGKSEPMRAYRVVRFRVEPRQEAGRRASPFVGREQELAAVASFLARIPEGKAGALLIEAEAASHARQDRLHPDPPSRPAEPGSGSLSPAAGGRPRRERP